MTEQPSQIEQLESRLDRGWELIAEAEQQSDDQAASRYTQRWLQLLADYEELIKTTPEPQSS